MAIFFLLCETLKYLAYRSTFWLKCVGNERKYISLSLWTDGKMISMLRNKGIRDKTIIYFQTYFTMEQKIIALWLNKLFAFLQSRKHQQIWFKSLYYGIFFSFSRNAWLDKSFGTFWVFMGLVRLMNLKKTIEKNPLWESFFLQEKSRQKVEKRKN